MGELPGDRCSIRTVCGGCPSMPRSDEEQLADKLLALQRTLGRAPDRLIASPLTLGYRARIDLQVGPSGLGYHRPRSREQVPVSTCAIARPELNATLAQLQGADLSGVERLELRSDGQKVVISAQGRALRFTQGEHVALNGRTLRGDPSLNISAGGVTHRLSPMSFYQVNLEVNALLVEDLRRIALSFAPTGVLDLFAGAGNLSLPLAAAGVPVTLIEQEGSSVRDAEATVRALKLPATVQRRDAMRFVAGEQFFDLALLDPPRAGAGDLLQRLLLTRPKAVLYVSCNPVALNRELRPAFAAGYTLHQLLAYDMFPQTPHVELLAVLGRPT